MHQDDILKKNILPRYNPILKKWIVPSTNAPANAAEPRPEPNADEPDLSSELDLVDVLVVRSLNGRLERADLDRLTEFGQADRLHEHELTSENGRDWALERMGELMCIFEQAAHVYRLNPVGSQASEKALSVMAERGTFSLWRREADRIGIPKDVQRAQMKRLAASALEWFWLLQSAETDDERNECFDGLLDAVESPNDAGQVLNCILKTDTWFCDRNYHTALLFRAVSVARSDEDWIKVWKLAQQIRCGDIRKMAEFNLDRMMSSDMAACVRVYGTMPNTSKIRRKAIRRLSNTGLDFDQLLILWEMMANEHCLTNPARRALFDQLCERAEQHRDWKRLIGLPSVRIQGSEELARAMEGLQATAQTFEDWVRIVLYWTDAEQPRLALEQLDRLGTRKDWISLLKQLNHTNLPDVRNHCLRRLAELDRPDPDGEVCDSFRVAFDDK